MNKCDLEETKHFAVEKFLYLCSHSVEWKRKYCQYAAIGVTTSYQCDGFTAYINENGFVALLSDVTIYSVSNYSPRVHDADNSKAVSRKRKLAREVAEKFEADVCVKAYHAMVKAYDDREKKKRDDENCLKLQAALFPQPEVEQRSNKVEVVTDYSVGVPGPCGSYGMPPPKQKSFWRSLFRR